MATYLNHVSDSIAPTRSASDLADELRHALALIGEDHALLSAPLHKLAACDGQSWPWEPAAAAARASETALRALSLSIPTARTLAAHVQVHEALDYAALAPDAGAGAIEPYQAGDDADLGRLARLLLAEAQRLDAVLARIEVLLDRLAAPQAGPSGVPWSPAKAAARRAGIALGQLIAAIPALDRQLPAGTLVFRELALHQPSRTAWYRSNPVRLAGKELALLGRLMASPRTLLTKTQLLAEVWGLVNIYSRTLDCHASRLRQALVRAGAPRDRYVINVWGVGYSLVHVHEEPSS